MCASSHAVPPVRRAGGPAGRRVPTSRWEKHNQALCLQSGSNERPTEGKVAPCTHPSDGSTHVILNPADAQRIIDLGWAELHPPAYRRRPSGPWTAHDLTARSNGLYFLPDGHLVAAMMTEPQIGVWTGSGFACYTDLTGWLRGR
jgi:hypothetical protein